MLCYPRLDYTIYSILHTPYSILYTLYSILCTLYSILYYKNAILFDAPLKGDPENQPLAAAAAPSAPQRLAAPLQLGAVQRQRGRRPCRDRQTWQGPIGHRTFKICVYIYIYVHSYVYIYICIYFFIYMYMYSCMCVRDRYVYTHIYTHTHEKPQQSPIPC